MNVEIYYTLRIIIQILTALVALKYSLYFYHYTRKGGNGIGKNIKFILYAILLEFSSGTIIVILNLLHNDTREAWFAYFTIFRVAVGITSLVLIITNTQKIIESGLDNVLAESERHLIDRLTRESRLSLRLKRYLHILAHDLQTPVTTASGFISVIRNEYPELREKTELGTDFQYLQSSIEQMSRLIEGLLQYARLVDRDEFDLPTLERVSVKDLIETSVNAIKWMLISKKATITLNLEKGIFVRGHEDSLLRVMQNLLANSLKFADKERPLKIEVNSYSTQTEVVVEVLDNGIGIKPEYLGLIFDIYRRLNKNIEGMGLGLSICRELVEQHKGTIQADSEYGKWTSITFRLPRSQ